MRNKASIHRALIIFIAAISILYPTPGYSKGKIYALLGKNGDDFNFQLAAAGCAEAAKKNGDMCIDISSKGPAHPRRQAAALEAAVEEHKLSGLAVSVVHSKTLACTIRRSAKDIPLITFDSNFKAGDLQPTLMYIGPDNSIIGKKLADIARRLKPKGGTVCLMTDRHDTNLQERIHGIRCELSNDPAFPEGKRLEGENNWYESSFSPLNAGDSTQRVLQLVEKVINDIKPDVFISVGHWPILDAKGYRKVISSHKQELFYNKLIMICATGNTPLPMKKLLEDRLFHGIVNFDFYHIGALCYKYMRETSEGGNIPAKVIVPASEMLGADVSTPE